MADDTSPHRIIGMLTPTGVVLEPLSQAKLRQNASLEDIDYRAPRGLDKSLIARLGACEWLREHLNVLLIGPTGIGRSWLGNALAQEACREGFSARYLRLPRLFQELAIAKGDGRYPKLLNEFAKADLLVLDDLCMAPLTDEQQRDLLEILDDRFNVRSTLVTSQLPQEHWHQHLGDPTLADGGPGYSNGCSISMWNIAPTVAATSDGDRQRRSIAVDSPHVFGRFLGHWIAHAVKSTITVGRPVTRPPPYRSPRAELPHGAPQSYSLRTVGDNVILLLRSGDRGVGAGV